MDQFRETNGDVLPASPMSNHGDEDSEELVSVTTNHQYPVQATLPPVNESDTVIEEIRFIIPVSGVREALQQDEDSEDMQIVSAPFAIRSFLFKLLVYPRGQRSNRDAHGQAGVFLARLPHMEEIGPSQQRAYTHFSLRALSKTDERWDVSNVSSKCFLPGEESNWGYRRFMAIDDLLNPKKAFISESDKLEFEVILRLVEGTSHEWGDLSLYDSKTMTGMVGILNQGATCYMNSVLQTLFFTEALRRGVFLMPTVPQDGNSAALVELDKDKEKNVPLAVQRVFYRLQTNTSAVATQELTTSFGWGGAEAFRQHDVQEFLRVLMDNIEEKMKSTKVESLQSLVSDLFMAKMKSYIKCTRVDYESARVEDYYDIQLKVKGVGNLHDSFKDYISVEKLDGDNKYQAEGHGLQDAEKGIIFQSFPRVLHLQLRRFEYDMFLDESVKVNDRFEFPDSMNLDEFLEEDDPSAPADYVLHSVLVQVGSVQFGHYVAYIRPVPKSGQWYKFDDETVTKCQPQEALNSNFGGVTADGRITHGSAYMLVYIRKSDAEAISEERKVDDIPPYLSEYFRREEEEINLRGIQEEELRQHYRKVVIVQEQDIVDSVGVNIIKKRAMRESAALNLQMVRTSTNVDVMDRISELTNIPRGVLRVHQFISRENRTFRPDSQVKSLNVGFFDDSRDTVFCMALHGPPALVNESGEEPDDEHPRQDLGLNDSLLFFKKYFPEEKEVRMIGCTYVPSNSIIRDLIPTVKSYASFETEELICFEELKQNDIRPVDLDGDMSMAELQNGDILVWEAIKFGARGVTPDYYNRLANEVVVQFKDLNNYEEEESSFFLTLDKRHSYMEVVTQLAEHLDFPEPRMLQLTGHNWVRDCPVMTHKISSTTEDLMSMLPNNAERILYYERLANTIDVVESQTLLGDLSILNFEDFSITRRPSLAAPDATVDEVISDIVQSEKLDPRSVADYRLLQLTDDYTIHQVEEPTTVAADLAFFKLRLEKVPLDQVILSEMQRLVQVQHMWKTINNLHGIPFLFLVLKDEPIEQFKRRLQEFINVDDSEFEKWSVHAQINASVDLILLTAGESPSILWEPNLRIYLNHKLQHNKRRKRNLEDVVKIHN